MAYLNKDYLYERSTTMDDNKHDCPCKRIKCERHENCVACKEYHHASGRKLLTACERIKAKEERKTDEKNEHFTRSRPASRSGK
jgi:hypothetical protein